MAAKKPAWTRCWVEIEPGRQRLMETDGKGNYRSYGAQAKKPSLRPDAHYYGYNEGLGMETEGKADFLAKAKSLGLRPKEPGER